jgi:hypothetical protein
LNATRLQDLHNVLFMLLTLVFNPRWKVQHDTAWHDTFRIPMETKKSASSGMAFVNYLR